MKQLYTIILFLCAISLLQAQNDCPAAGNRMYKEAQKARKDSLYDKAINKATSARNCDPNLASEADALILEIFKDIDMQKRTAVKNEKLAEQRRLQAEEETRKAQSLALTSAANLAIFKDEDYTKGFRYAQYAWEKDSNNIEAKIALYRTVYQPINKPYKTFCRSLFCHNGIVSSMNISNNGQNIVSASWDKNIRIWNTETGILIDTLPTSEKSIRGAWFSPDNKYIVSIIGTTIGYEAVSEIKIWDLIKKKWVFDTTEVGGIKGLIFDKEKNNIIYYGFKFLKERHIETGRFVHNYNADSFLVNNVTFSPNRNILVALGTYINGFNYAKSKIKIWDTSSKKNLMNFTTSGCREIEASDCFFSEDGEQLFFSDRNEIYVLNISTFAIEKKWQPYSQGIAQLIKSPDGTRFVSSPLENSSIKVWDIYTHKLLYEIPNNSKALYEIFFSPNGKYIMATYHGGSAKLWVDSVNTFNLYGQGSTITQAEFLPDGISLICGYENGEIKKWYLENPRTTTNLIGHNDWVTGAVYSTDNKFIVTYGFDGNINLWDIQKAQYGNDTLRPYRTFKHSDVIESLVFSKGNENVISVSRDTSIKVWDIKNDSLIKSIKAHNNEVTSITYSEDYSTLITTSRDSTIKIWNPKTYELLQTIKLNNIVYKIIPISNGLLVACMRDSIIPILDKNYNLYRKLKNSEYGTLDAIELNDKKIMLIGRDGVASIWDIEKNMPITNIVGHNASIYLNNNLILTSSLDGNIRVYDLQTYKLLNIFHESETQLFDVKLSENFNLIAVPNGHIIKLRDIFSGKLIAELFGHKASITKLILHPDGKKILSISDDKTAKIWLIDIRDITNRYNNKIDDLSPEEKQKYGIKP